MRRVHLSALSRGRCAGAAGEAVWLAGSRHDLRAVVDAGGPLGGEAGPGAGTAVAVGFSHVTFVDDSGRLLSCGTEDFDAGVDRPGLLGHGEGVRRLAQPTRLPVTGQRVRFRSVSSGVAHTLAVSERGDVFAWGAPAPLRLLVDS